jgi:teichuronic acid biosynthesis glycosyltransferase TuaC
MRVLAITSCHPNPQGPRHCVYHQHKMRALSRMHDLRLIVPVAWRKRFGTPANAASDVPANVSFPTYWYTPRILEQFYGRFYLASIKSTVRRALQNFQPDLVFACWAHPDGWAAGQIAKRLGVPVVIKVIGSDVLVLSRRRKRRGILAKTLQSADAVIAVNRDLANHVNQLGVNPRNIHVVPEGIDTEVFRPGDRSAARASLGIPDGAKMVLFVGSLLMSKGAGVLIEACAKLAAKVSEFRCYLVGSGGDAAALHRMVHAQKLGGRVCFAGSCTQGKLVQWYHACDVVALPSFSEGIPNVLRESLQCGRPFVATHVGGIPEISDPAYSRLVAPGNVGELAAGLESMLLSPPVFEVSAAGRVNITWSRSAEMISDVFHRVCEAKSTALPLNSAVSELSNLAAQ